MRGNTHTPTHTQVEGARVGETRRTADLDRALLLPPLSTVRDCAFAVALDVARLLIANRHPALELSPAASLDECLGSEQFSPASSDEEH
jgi:hypothetical protein